MLKYKLEQLIQLHGTAISTLATKCHVSSQTIRNWCNIEGDDTKSIPGDKLRIIAVFYGHSMEFIHTDTKAKK